MYQQSAEEPQSDNQVYVSTLVDLDDFDFVDNYSIDQHYTCSLTISVTENKTEFHGRHFRSNRTRATKNKEGQRARTLLIICPAHGKPICKVAQGHPASQRFAKSLALPQIKELEAMNALFRNEMIKGTEVHKFSFRTHPEILIELFESYRK